MLPPPQLLQAKAIYRQIGDHVRELIVSGKLVPETKLPATNELAASWRTTPMTIQKALAPLVKEGLLTRVPKRGTFVRRREKKLTCVGVFDGVAVNASLYSQTLHKALKEELRQADIEMDVWLDPRPEDQFAEPWLPFLNAAAHREFQAVIVTGTNQMHLRWQTKLPVPTAFQGAENHPNGATFDMPQFAELSVRALAQQGCRSVGIIAGLSTANTNMDGSRHIYTDFFERLMNVIGDLGLTVKNEWMRVPTSSTAVTGATHEQFGYEEFLKLWNQPERPQGLIVHDDATARGVILGLQARQVRVPEDLKLVLHKNESIELFCPMPATFVVSSERAMAKALIQQVQKQFRGESCEPILISFDVESNAGR